MERNLSRIGKCQLSLGFFREQVVDELLARVLVRRTCDLHALSNGIRLTLDLADVSFADAAGIELLKELRIRLVTLLRPSSLVAEQLKA